MLRRLLIAYLSLLLAAVAAFGVPFGILWANRAQADETSALRQSATEASRSVSFLLRRDLSGHLTVAQVPRRDRDRDGDRVAFGLRLSAAQQASVATTLADFMSGTRTLVALIGGDGRVAAALGRDQAAAARLASATSVVAALGQAPSQATAGQIGLRGGDLAYATASVRVQLPDPREPPLTPALGDRPALTVGTVVVAEPAGVVGNRVRTIAIELAALGAAILITGAVAGWGVVRSLVRPLKDIEAAVGELGGGDLGARAPVGKGPPELVALAETVNVMADTLGDLITAQRAFVADASHQLRTPLTALRLRLEGLAAGKPTPADELGAILSEVERLSRLVTGLLGLARAEEAPALPVATDVTGVLAGRAEAWQSLAEEQGITLVCDADGARPGLVVAEDLEQALDNLIDNALRVAPAGTTVRLGAGEEGGWIALHVVDQGPGMPPDDRIHAFDRFWTRKAERGRGSGLGLAIVARLVHNSGGDVELRDGPDGTGIDAVVRLRPA